MATVGFGDFEWDEDKARSNLEKHGVSFEEASSVFLDPDFLAIDDMAHDLPRPHWTRMADAIANLASRAN